MINQYFSNEKKMRILVNLFQRFNFLTFNELMKSSPSDCIINSATILLLISMVILDHQKERSILNLKAKDSFMDCTFCSILSRVVSQYNKSSNFRNPQLSSEDEDLVRSSISPRINTDRQVYRTVYPKHEVSKTL